MVLLGLMLPSKVRLARHTPSVTLPPVKLSVQPFFPSGPRMQKRILLVLETPEFHSIVEWCGAPIVGKLVIPARHVLKNEPNRSSQRLSVTFVTKKVIVFVTVLRSERSKVVLAETANPKITLPKYGCAPHFRTKNTDQDTTGLSQKGGPCLSQLWRRGSHGKGEPIAIIC